MPEPVYVTRPTLPSLERFRESLEQVWDSRVLTNGGAFHQRLEAALCARLGVEHLSLFCNGTIALLVALQALRVSSGEVITTPFTFPATPHVLHWNGVTPVFCDIDPVTFNLCPEQVEALITPRTLAILPVHVFGQPCDVEALARISNRHGLRLIYDAAHAFGVRAGGRSIASFGDLTMLSFHATKLFTTIEGGALVSGSAALKARIDFLKNFGIADEETVVGPGINGKLNELQSAFGLLQLEQVDVEIAARRAVSARYRARLAGLPGLRLPPLDAPGVESNCSYFPVLVDRERFGLDRDALYAALKLFDVHARKYFHPLCSQIPAYRALPSAAPDRLPVAERVARQVLCLPIYGQLRPDVVERIADILWALHERASRG
ncbi:MAG: DegT/DnrJ/EryC1/StrS family aminotransferase [Planctomycetes bacterium]|nr:DegT/DnrJ/EryC1/StrS family aminotransferase [Planctomycetota bacterium]